MRTKLHLLGALCLGLAVTGLAKAESFEVVHIRTAWPNGSGTLHIDENGVRFEAEKEKRNRSWGWLDIQYVDRISATELELLTYEDQKRYLGRDKSYRFRLTGGELSDGLMARIETWFGRPVTDRVIREASATRYQIPVKHQHSFGGCEGELKFTNETVQYVTAHEKDAREWLLDRDVASVWSAHPYHLELHVYENNRREFSRTRVYKFDLKEKLDPQFYRQLKLHLYNLESD